MNPLAQLGLDHQQSGGGFSGPLGTVVPHPPVPPLPALHLAMARARGGRRVKDRPGWPWTGLAIHAGGMRSYSAVFA